MDLVWCLEDGREVEVGDMKGLEVCCVESYTERQYE